MTELKRYIFSVITGDKDNAVCVEYPVLSSDGPGQAWKALSESFILSDSAWCAVLVRIEQA